MKIMQLLPELNSGGVERGTLELAQALIDAGHQSIVTSNGGRLVKLLEQQGSRHIQLPIHRKSLASLWQIRPLRQLILREQPDIVHVRSRVPAWLTYFALKRIPVSQRPVLVSTVHGFYSVNRYSEIMTQADAVIAVSDSVVDYIRSNYPRCPPHNITRIFRGIDPLAFPHGYQPSSSWLEHTLSEFPALRNKYVIALPGRITRLKGHELFIELIAQLKQEFPQIHGVVIGGIDPKKQSYANELHSQITQRGLNDTITFTGHRSDMRDWLAYSQLVVSLSTQAETFGRTVLEALALGTPVIGWDRGGVREILNHLFPYGLVDVDNQQQFINTVRQCIIQPPTIPPVTEFQLDQMTGQTIDLYHSLLKSK